MNSNDNSSVYVVQCTKDNLEDVHCMLKMSARVLDVDTTNNCIKTFSIDSTTKRRLSDAGASFWQEVACVSAARQKF
jgi:hypothetical protein